MVAGRHPTTDECMQKLDKVTTQFTKHMDRVAAVAAAVLVAFAFLIVGLWWKGEHDSCMRSNNVRDAFNVRGDLEALAAHETGHRVRIARLDCGFPIPQDQGKLVVK